MDVSDWLLIWLYVTTHPSEETFEQERKNPEASLSIALLWIVLAVLISGALAVIEGMYRSGSFTLSGGIYGMMSEMDIPSELAGQFSTTPLMGGPTVGLGAAIVSILVTTIGFLVNVGLLFVSARMVGGTGNFGRYAYLIASFSAPLSILASLLGYIPFVGDFLGLFLWLYQLVLTYFAVKVEHNLSRRKTIIAMLVPFLLGIFLVVAVLLLLVYLGVPLDGIMPF